MKKLILAIFALYAFQAAKAQQDSLIVNLPNFYHQAGDTFYIDIAPTTEDIISIDMNFGNEGARAIRISHFNTAFVPDWIPDTNRIEDALIASFSDEGDVAISLFNAIESLNLPEGSVWFRLTFVAEESGYMDEMFAFYGEDQKQQVFYSTSQDPTFIYYEFGERMMPNSSSFENVHDFKVYPNPLMNEQCVFIEGLNESGTNTIEVFNLIGQLKYRTTLLNAQNEIQFPYLEPGMYFLSVHIDGEKRAIKPIVIK